jgi:hypothetical protein
MVGGLDAPQPAFHPACAVRKELGYHAPRDRRVLVWSSLPAALVENTFEGVFSKRRDTRHVPEHKRSGYGAKKLDPILLNTSVCM